MGNTPGKESRNYPTNGSSSSTTSSNGSMSTSQFTRDYLTNFEESVNNSNSYNYRGYNHNRGHYGHNHNHGHNDSYDLTSIKKKKEKENEKIKFKTKQIMNLVVNYDENVDGGYLAPYGNYKYNLDYMTDIVRDLIIKRKLSPFFTPLQDFNENWSDEELLKFLKKNLKLHEDININYLNDDEFEDPNEHKLHSTTNSIKRKENKLFKQKLKEKAVESQNHEIKRFKKDFKLHESVPNKYLNIPSDDLLIRIYKDCEECPICFLYYPKLLNTTRCCDQSICTECFVQMKRLDPHFPHDENENNENNDKNNSEDLISEPVKCPFCAVDDFGVTYLHPKDFKTGIEGNCKPSNFKFVDKNVIEEENEEEEEEEEGGGKVIGEDNEIRDDKNKIEKENLEVEHEDDNEDIISDVSDILTEIDLADPFSTKKLRIEQKRQEKVKSKENKNINKGNNKNHRRNTSNSQSDIQLQSNNDSNDDNNNNNNTITRKRRPSLPPDAPSVVTIDMIRPDWEQKLLTARTKLARRSAAATALHATSLLNNSNNNNYNSNFYGNSSSGRNSHNRGFNYGNNHRQEQLEELLIEEAMRLSLLDEEERKMRELTKNSS